jgi:hypothetical protein
MLVEVEFVTVELLATNSPPTKLSLTIFIILPSFAEILVTVALVSVAFPEFISAEEIFAVVTFAFVMFAFPIFAIREFEVEALVVLAFEVIKFELLPKRLAIFPFVTKRLLITPEIKFAKLAKRLVEVEFVIVELFAVNSLPEKIAFEIFSKLEFVPERDVIVALVSVAFPELICALPRLAAVKLAVPVAFKLVVFRVFS